MSPAIRWHERADHQGLEGLGMRERTDRHVVSVRIPEGELLCVGVRVHVGLLFEPVDERASALKGSLVVVDAEKQEESVAR